jgi:hypothetical protein
MIDYSVDYFNSKGEKQNATVQAADVRAAIKVALLKLSDVVRVVNCHPKPDPKLDEPSY